MIRPFIRIAVAAAGLALIAGCSRTATDGSTAASTPHSELPAADGFDDYWYSHGAELSRYALEQSRYGSIHSGDAVLIYVTEPIDTVAQVKSDDPVAPTAVPGFKLNMTKTFTTGIYPYSMMTTILSPLDRETYPEPLKVTTTSQEWCGHTFTQLNRAGDGYNLQQFSYFQSEGDEHREIPASHSEDGIWTQIRLAPASLPTGRFQLVPAAMYTRLAHQTIQPYAAVGFLTDDPGTGMNGEAMRAYTLEYPTLKRTLTIRFHRDFPHVIEGWSETYPGFDGTSLTTTATRTHSIMLAYWSHHNPLDRALRPRLGLDPD